MVLKIKLPLGWFELQFEVAVRMHGDACHLHVPRYQHTSIAVEGTIKQFNYELPCTYAAHDA